MRSEPGLFPSTYLRLLLSQRAAAPGTRVSLRVDGTDAASLVRGKMLRFDRQTEEGWKHLGLLLGTRSADGRSLWRPTGSGSGAMVMTLEGYSGTMPLYFDVPPVPAGECRIRLDLTHMNEQIGDIRHRTVTLYGYLLVLPDAVSGGT